MDNRNPGGSEPFTDGRPDFGSHETAVCEEKAPLGSTDSYILCLVGDIPASIPKRCDEFGRKDLRFVFDARTGHDDLLSTSARECSNKPEASIQLEMAVLCPFVDLRKELFRFGCASSHVGRLFLKVRHGATDGQVVGHQLLSSLGCLR